MHRVSRRGTRTPAETEGAEAPPASPGPPMTEREKWFARAVARNGADWVERHKVLLDDQWDFIESL